MTPHPDIERKLDHWLAPDDARVPDRVVERALANIDHIPQRRRIGAPRRLNEMPTTLRLLAAAALLVAAGGAAYLLVGADRPPDDAGPPIDIMAINDSAATWTASRPGVFGHPAGTYEFDTYTTLTGRAPDGTEFDIGIVTTDGSNATIAATAICPDEGSYRYRRTVDLLEMTIEVVDDPCVDRRSFLVGEWLRLRSDQWLTVGESYRVAMGVDVAVTIPPWPGAGEQGPDAELIGDPGRAPRILAFSVPDSSGTTWDYAIKIVVDPTIAADLCDVAKGSLPADWTFDDFVDPARAGTWATMSNARETTVAGFPAIAVDVAGSPSCYNDQFRADQCCPDDILWWSTGGRMWAVDLGSRKVLLSIVGNRHGLTDEQLQIGEALVASLELTP